MASEYQIDRQNIISFAMAARAARTEGAARREHMSKCGLLFYILSSPRHSYLLMQIASHLGPPECIFFAKIQNIKINYCYRGAQREVGRKIHILFVILNASRQIAIKGSAELTAKKNGEINIDYTNYLNYYSDNFENSVYYFNSRLKNSCNYKTGLNADNIDYPKVIDTAVAEFITDPYLIIDKCPDKRP